MSSQVLKILVQFRRARYFLGNTEKVLEQSGAGTIYVAIKFHWQCKGDRHHRSLLTTEGQLKKIYICDDIMNAKDANITR